MNSVNDKQQSLSNAQARQEVSCETLSNSKIDISRISPLYNEVFLKVFGESKSSSRSFVNAVLRVLGMPEIEEIDYIETDATIPSTIGLKAPRCDVALVAGDRIFDLEAQKKRVNIDNKTLFYASKLLCSHTPKGGDGKYNNLPQVVAIVLLDGQKRFAGPQYITRNRLVWEREGGIEESSDRIAVVIIELEKVAEAYNGGITKEVLADELTAWLYLLARGYRDQKEVDAIVGSFPTIEEFAAQYGIAIDDPIIKRSYEAYQESEMEWNSIIDEAERDARKQGMREGLEEGFAEGREKGLKKGLKIGHEEGLKIGREEGREEGRMEGREEGRREGREEGRMEGQEELASQLRALGVPEETVAEALRRAGDNLASC